ncbi:hypothetical protein NQ315_014545 [Exocentrus adspersus]|uniref:Uncharacterized protein n=1 Tax=Exocentrus adspersus TaxID=1586481 RepID=A0AAV8VL94_9CUCU|nr:hypothetical protein NQ315_014545 [Exocentrus adspersus]
MKRKEFMSHPSQLAAAFVNPTLKNINFSEDEINGAIDFIMELSGQLNLNEEEVFKDIGEYYSNQSLWANENIWKASKAVDPRTWWQVYCSKRALMSEEQLFCFINQANEDKEEYNDDNNSGNNLDNVVIVAADRKEEKGLEEEIDFEENLHSESEFSGYSDLENELIQELERSSEDESQTDEKTEWYSTQENSMEIEMESDSRNIEENEVVELQEGEGQNSVKCIQTEGDKNIILVPVGARFLKIFEPPNSNNNN